MFDAHNHLDLDGEAAPERWAEALAAGLTGAVLAGVDPAGWAAQAGLVQQFTMLHLCYGVHPWTAADAQDAELDGLLALLVKQLDEEPRPVALGELGLDHGRRGPRPTRARQERAFRAQLALARERDLPLVLHVVQAHGRALEILRQDGLPRAGGMVHRWSGPVELVGDYVGLGLHLSFSPAILHTPRLVEAARRTPAPLLLVETDAPDALPAGGAEITPASLPQVIAAVAQARGAPPEAIAALTEANARRLYRLSPA